MKDEFCEQCQFLLSQGVAKYSWDRFGKPLCMKCQQDARIEENPKLGSFINKQINKKYPELIH